jgi:hypothetical protein
VICAWEYGLIWIVVERKLYVTLNSRYELTKTSKSYTMLITCSAHIVRARTHTCIRARARAHTHTHTHTHTRSCTHSRSSMFTVCSTDDQPHQRAGEHERAGGWEREKQKDRETERETNARQTNDQNPSF